METREAQILGTYKPTGKCRSALEAVKHDDQMRPIFQTETIVLLSFRNRHKGARSAYLNWAVVTVG